jgi:hypothetical protein
MNSNRHRDKPDPQRKQPDSYPEQETGAPVPDPDEIKARKLDLRSNAENDWQDEMPDEAGRRSREPERSSPKQPERSSHKRKDAAEEGDTGDEEPDDAFSDSDSARVSGR